MCFLICFCFVLFCELGSKEVCEWSWDWVYDVSKISPVDEDCQANKKEVKDQNCIQHIGSNVESSTCTFCSCWSIHRGLGKCRPVLQVLLVNFSNNLTAMTFVSLKIIYIQSNLLFKILVSQNWVKDRISKSLKDII